MRTWVYVDGFNLFYGALKGTPYKWLDIVTMCQKILSDKNDIVRVNYYTASIKSNSLKAERQSIYLRALTTRPEVKVIRGTYLSHIVKMPYAHKRGVAEVVKQEEKGTDVNLAANLINDAWLDNYDCAIIISNDSDMAEAMRLVRQYHPQKILGLFTPGQGRTSKQLQSHAHFVRTIPQNVLAASQFPDSLSEGRIRKPINW
jgi:uncharacterized LabA/DUF88 family protein